MSETETGITAESSDDFAITPREVLRLFEERVDSVSFEVQRDPQRIVTIIALRAPAEGGQ